MEHFDELVEYEFELAWKTKTYEGPVTGGRKGFPYFCGFYFQEPHCVLKVQI